MPYKTDDSSGAVWWYDEGTDPYASQHLKTAYTNQKANNNPDPTDWQYGTGTTQPSWMTNVENMWNPTTTQPVKSPTSTFSMTSPVASGDASPTTSPSSPTSTASASTAAPTGFDALKALQQAQAAGATLTRTPDGGYLANGVPLNVYAGYGWLPGQLDALKAFNSGSWTTGGWTGTGSSTDGSAPPTTLTGLPTSNPPPSTDLQLPGDAESMYRFLAQYGLDRSELLNPLYDRQIQMMDALSGRFNDLSTRQDQTVQQLMGQWLPALEGIIGRSNVAEGFSPETLSALRSEATSTIPKQYEDAARQMRLQLLRSGAIGAGELPGDAGAILQAMGPLDQARAEAVAGANRQNIIGNEQEMKRTLDLNRQRGQEAISQLMSGTGMLADIYNPQPYATLAQNAQAGALNTFNAQGGALQQSLQAATGLADMEPGSFKNILLSSLLGNAGGILSLLTGKGGDGGGLIGDIIDWIGGGDSSSGGTDGASGSSGSNPISKAISAVGGALGTAGKAVWGALSSNPATLPIALGVVGTAVWLKSQAHWEANTWVQDFQNPFDSQMGDLNQQFYQLAQSGQLTKTQAQQIRTAAAELLRTYEQKRTEFSRQGSDEAEVAQNALNTFKYWYGDGGTKFLGDMDAVIAGLA
jgi:hypothetical protein